MEPPNPVATNAFVMINDGSKEEPKSRVVPDFVEIFPDQRIPKIPLTNIPATIVVSIPDSPKISQPLNQFHMYQNYPPPQGQYKDSGNAPLQQQIPRSFQTLPPNLFSAPRSAWKFD
jgi:hypothetical protein